MPRVLVVLLLCFASFGAIAMTSPDATAGASLAEPAPATASWWSLGVDATLDGLPTNGVLVVPADFQPGGNVGTASEALAYVSFVVTDAGGLEQPGTLAFDETHRLLIWTGAMPFAAQATYGVSVVFDNTALAEASAGFGGQPDQTHLFQVTTGDGPAEPVAEPQVLSRALSAPVDGCSSDGADTVYAPQLTLQAALETQPGVPPDYVVLSAYPETASGEKLGACLVTDGRVSCAWAQPAEQYCYSVQAHSLLDDSVAFVRQCAPASEVVQGASIGCPLQPADGCSVLGTRRGGSPAPLAALLALGLACAGLAACKRRGREASPRA